MSKTQIKSIIKSFGTDNFLIALGRSKRVSAEIERNVKIRRLELELRKLNLVRTH